MVGLYDGQGVLRFVGSSSQACVDYADLFELPLVRCFLEALPEPTSIKIREHRRRAGCSN